MAMMAKALGHPARVAIMDYLVKVDTCICGDIVNEISLAQPTISQHLRELKNAGLIKGEIEGSSICYCVNKSAMQRLQKYLNRIIERSERKKKLCG